MHCTHAQQVLRNVQIMIKQELKQVCIKLK